MGKLFGTDGIRGIVNETLGAELAFAVGRAAARVLAQDTGKEKPLFTIGKDTRISSDLLEGALIPRRSCAAPWPPAPGNTWPGTPWTKSCPPSGSTTAASHPPPPRPFEAGAPWQGDHSRYWIYCANKNRGRRISWASPVFACLGVQRGGMAREN